MPITWKQLSQTDEFNALPFEQKEKVRNVYFDSYIAPSVAEQNLPQIRALYDEKTKADVVKQNTGIVGDTADIAQRGMYGAIESAANLADMTVGVGGGVRDWAAKKADEQLKTLSPEGRKSYQKEIFQGGEEWDDVSLGEGASDPRTWTLRMAEVIGGQLPLLGGGKIAAAGAEKVIGAVTRKLAKSADDMVASGMAREAAQKVIENRAKAAATAASMIGFGAAETAITAGGVGTSVKDKMMALPAETKAQSVPFQQNYWALRQSEPKLTHAQAFEKAWEQTADQAAKSAAFKTAPFTFLFGAAVGPFYDSLLRVGTKQSLAEIPKAAGVEALQEGPQSGVEHYQEQAAIRDFGDARVDPKKGLLASSLEGTVFGAGAGGMVAVPPVVASKVVGRDAQAVQSTPSAQAVPPVDSGPEAPGSFTVNDELAPDVATPKEAALARVQPKADPAASERDFAPPSPIALTANAGDGYPQPIDVLATLEAQKQAPVRKEAERLDSLNKLEAYLARRGQSKEAFEAAESEAAYQKERDLNTMTQGRDGPEMVRAKSGKPFQNMQSANIFIRQKKLEGYRAVPNPDGTWDVKRTDYFDGRLAVPETRSALQGLADAELEAVGASVGVARPAIAKAIAAKKMGVGEAGIVTTLLNRLEDSAALGDVSKRDKLAKERQSRETRSLQDQLAQWKRLHDLAKVPTPEPAVPENDYAPDMDVASRALYSLAKEAVVAGDAPDGLSDAVAGKTPDQAATIIGGRIRRIKAGLPPAPGGAAVTPHAPPRAPKAKKPVQVDPKKDSLLTAIAKLGGLDVTEAEAQGIDPAIWRGKRKGGAHAGVFGRPWIRRTGGHTFDGMAELLSQHGYFPPGVDYSPNALLELIDKELRGQKVYAPQGADSEAERLYNDRLEAEEERLAIQLAEEAVTSRDIYDALLEIDSLPPRSESYTDEDIEDLFGIDTAAQEIAGGATQGTTDSATRIGVASGGEKGEGTAGDAGRAGNAAPSRDNERDSAKQSPAQERREKGVADEAYSLKRNLHDGERGDQPSLLDQEDNAATGGEPAAGVAGRSDAQKPGASAAIDAPGPSDTDNAVDQLARAKEKTVAHQQTDAITKMAESVTKLAEVVEKLSRPEVKEISESLPKQEPKVTEPDIKNKQKEDERVYAEQLKEIREKSISRFSNEDRAEGEAEARKNWSEALAKDQAKADEYSSKKPFARAKDSNEQKNRLNSIRARKFLLSELDKPIDEREVSSIFDIDSKIQGYVDSKPEETSTGLAPAEATTQLSNLIGSRSAQAMIESGRVVLVEDGGGMPKGADKFSKADQTETPAFKAWFQDSKVVDKNGNPLRMYHGTALDFKSFDSEKVKSNYPYSFGFHFTSRTQEAGTYAEMAPNEGVPSKDKAALVMPVFISAKNPLILNAPRGQSASMVSDLDRADIISKIVASRKTKNPYDSVIIKRERGDEYDGWNVIVFKPEQVKSAIGNTGVFDPTNPDIRYSKNEQTLGATTADGKMYLNLAALDKDSFDGVALHEGIHGTLKTTIGEQDYNRLMQRMGGLRKMSKNGKGDVSKFFRDAIAAIPSDTNEADINEEIAAYAVERYINSPRSLPQTIAKWVKDFIAAIRVGLMRHLPKDSKLRGTLLDSASEADLARLAIVGLRRAAKGAEASVGEERAVALFRGVKKDATGKTVGGAFFYSPDRAVAEVYAGSDGVVTRANITFKNLLFAETWFDAKDALGLPRSASMADLVAEARAAGHDGVTFKTSNGPEYIHIPDASVGDGVMASKRAADQTETPEFKAWFGDWQASNIARSGSAAGDGDVNDYKRNGRVGENRSGNNARGNSSGTHGTSRPNVGILDREGRPAILYHGTRDDIAVFDLSHSNRKDNGWLGRGVYLTDDSRLAVSYANLKGGDAAPNVMPLYAAVKNPFYASLAVKKRLMNASRAFIDRVTDKFIQQGYDGVVLQYGDGTREIVAFRPEQVKSAIGNRGTFDPANPDIRYSKRKTEKGDPGRDYPSDYRNDKIASQKNDDADPIDIIDHLQKDVQSSAWQRIKDKASDWHPTLLGVLTLHQLVDIGERYLPKLKNYSRTVERMQADINAMQSVAAATADKWAAWSRKNRAEADTMTGIMHDSTIAGADPAEEFDASALTTAYRKRISVLTAVSLSRPGEDQTPRTEEMKHLRAKIKNLPQQAKDHKALKARFDRLSPDAQALYKEVRDSYLDQSEKMVEALKQRLKNSGASKEAQGRIMDELRWRFEMARLEGPYFPLARFGEYWAELIDASGERVFAMFETQGERREALLRLKKDGHTLLKQGRKLDNSRELFGTSSLFLGEVTNLLDKKGGVIAEELTDAIYQLYLQQLPDVSMRKAFIHRKKVKGFSDDALRAYATKMFHGASQIAKLRHSDTMARLIDDMRKSAKEEVDDTKHVALINELQKRHAWILNPTDSQLANKLTGLGFVWYLGLGVSSAIVNLTQTPVVALPVIGARFGLGKTTAALLAASKDVLGKRFAADEKAMLDKLEKDGVIDRTMAHDLAGIGEVPSGEYSDTTARAMRIVSFLFHHAERFNREATALAAYRLAGKNEKAVEYAADAVWQAHFNYSNANRARWMQSNTAKVLFLFKQYSLNMTYHLWRNFYQSVKGESPQVKAEARKTLVGTLGMTGLLAGAAGLPLYGVMMGAANALAAALGDDDEWDAEREFYAFLKEQFGADGADLILRGPAGDLTGADWASRSSLDGLWLRAPEKELEGTGYAHHLLEQVAGPVAWGLLGSWARGIELMGKGHTERGIEAMMPKFAKDGLRAIRYADEGAKSLRGDPLVEQFGAWELALQASGFTPEQLAEQYESNTRVKGAEAAIADKRQRLLAAMAMAVRAGDRDAQSAVMEKIKTFNAKHRGAAISGDSIRRSLMQGARLSARAEGGIIVNPRLGPELSQYE